MRVRFNKTYAHGSRRYEPGAIVDLPDRDARGLIQRGYCKLFIIEAQAPVTKAIEEPEHHKMVTGKFPFIHKKRGRPKKK